MNKQILTIGILFFFHGFMFCQSKLVSELKTAALYCCIINNYKAVDSTFDSKDVTISAVIQMNPISIETIESLAKYVKDKTTDFHKGYDVYPEKGTSNPNLIIYNCTKFYKSKELRQYIKNLIGLNRISYYSWE
ncbi:MAG: hypothetical protein LBP34_05080 [Flavobacteriaceae bacterium]|nr:hypothetical protein [Flavobacteriaceae bacterium]